MEEKKRVTKKIMEWCNIKKWKKDQFLIALLTGIFLLVIAIPTGSPKETESQKNEGETYVAGNKTETNGESYVEQLEERLEKVLSQVAGVGKVKTMITLETTEEKVVEKDEPVSKSNTTESDSQGGNRKNEEYTSSEETVFMEQEDGSRVPYVRTTIEPKIKGILVIAQGGGTVSVEKNISEAVMALFSVEAHKIKVMKME